MTTPKHIPPFAAYRQKPSAYYSSPALPQIDTNSGIFHNEHHGDTLDTRDHNSSTSPSTHKKIKFSSPQHHRGGRIPGSRLHSSTLPSPTFIAHTPSHTRSFSPPCSPSSKEGTSPRASSFSLTSPLSYLRTPVDAVIQHYLPEQELSPRAQQFANRTEAILDAKEALRKENKRIKGKIKTALRPTGLTRNSSSSSNESFIYE